MVPLNIYLRFRFVSGLLQPIYSQLGWSDPGVKIYPASVDLDYDRTLLRPIVINLLCDLGDVDCLKKVAEMFTEWRAGGAPIDPELRKVVYCHGMASASDFGTWSWMLEKYKVGTV